MISEAVLDLDAAATLAAAEAGVDAARREEVADLVRVLHWADLHADDPQEKPGAVPVTKGGDKLIQVGGEGTPKVSELCWAELAIAREVGVVAMENYAADALDLRHRLPLLYAAVLDGVVPVWVARKVATMSRKLTAERAGLVDAAVAAAAEQSPGRILSIAEAKVIEADPEAHKARIAADAAKVGVRLSQPKPGNTVDDAESEAGTRRVTLKLSTGAALDFDAAVDEIADALLDQITAQEGDCQLTRGELEAKAVELLTNPHAAAAFLDAVNETGGPVPPSAEDPDVPPPLPAPKKKRPATLLVHITDLVLSGAVPGVARVEGIGPMLLEQLRDLLGDRDIKVQPVIDLNESHSVNGYEYPTLVRERTLLRMLGDVFPHSTNQGYRRLDLDHATPYDPTGPPGQTGDRNAAPVTRKHHRAKTHQPYELRQLGLGVYRWVTPNGLGRLVTTAGTRRFQPITGPAGSVGEIYYAERFSRADLQEGVNS